MPPLLNRDPLHLRTSNAATPTGLSLGIDIGGTHGRIGLVDAEDRILLHQRMDTRSLTSATAFITALDTSLRELCARGPQFVDSSRAIGLALPGILDDEGIVRRCINLPWLENQPITKMLSEQIAAPVVVLTDADAATLGEYFAWTSIRTGSASDRSESNLFDMDGLSDNCGMDPPQRNRGTKTSSAKGTNRFIHLRVGTGIACGLLVDGVPTPIEPHRSGHLDILVIDRSETASTCRCGKRGCLDTVASGHALKERVNGLGFEMDRLSELHERGDAAVQALLQVAALALSQAVRNIGRELAPNAIVIGGGVLDRCPVLREWLFADLRAEWPTTARGDPVAVHPALLGDDVGIIGAAHFAAKTLDL